MAIAFDASSEIETGVSPAGPTTFTHTPVGTPKGVVIAIGQNSNPTVDCIGSVTYGGVALTRVVRFTDTTSEPGSADLWVLGSSVPTGPQTVSVTYSSLPGNKVHICAISVTATRDVEVVDSDGISGDTTNPSVTLQYGGRTCIAFAMGFTGNLDPANFVPNGNCTMVQTDDMGASSTYVLRQTTPGSADFAIGGTLALEDNAYAALALSEVPSASTADGNSAVFTGGGETTGGTLVIPTVSTGDDLFVLVCSRDHTDAIAVPTCTDNDSGGNAWTLLDSTTLRKGHRFWKKATASTSGKTITIAGAVGACAAGVTKFSANLAAVNPSTNVTQAVSSGASMSVPGFLPDFSGSEICLAIFNYLNNGVAVTSPACSNPGALTSHFVCDSGGGGHCSVTLVSAKQVGRTTTGNFTWTQANQANHSTVWAIRPATSPSLTAQNPVYTYAAAGTYTVTLIVTDNQGNVSDPVTSTVSPV